MKDSFLIVSIVAVALTGGCKKNNSVNAPIVNTPVVTNVPNAFTFNLNATAYTGTPRYTLSFSTDTLACSLTVTGKTTGSGSLIVVDSNYSTVYADSALSNQVVVFTQSGKGVPKRISMMFKSYAGTISFALSRSSAVQ